jgi:pimeloyl-ACP methyl ester carboxylesterase
MPDHARIRLAEQEVFDHYGVDSDETWLTLRHSGSTVRVVSAGQGPPVLLLHGATFCAAAWAPVLAELRGFRLHALDLPGHGLSGPGDYRLGSLRDFGQQLMDDVWEAFGNKPMPIVGNSLGSMLALWYAVPRPERVTTVIALGAPAIALPGTVVRMPLAMLNIPFVGAVMLRMPVPRLVYRRILAKGLGGGAVRSMPDAMVDTLQLAARAHAGNLAELNRAMNLFTRPRVENVMSATELGELACRPMFIWGAAEPYLSVHNARRQIAAIPGATLVEVAGGHAPWIDEPRRCAALIGQHLAATQTLNADQPRDNRPRSSRGEEP